MKTISIIYADKRKERVELGEKVGGGGAGDVYRVRGRPDEVIKVYKEGQRADYSAKIWAMLSVKPDFVDVDTGWPLYVAEESDGGFVGFGMPFFNFDKDKYYKFHLIVQTSDRIYENLPRHPSYRFVLAANLAHAIYTLHKLGHTCPDLKPGNLLCEKEKMRVLLLDCDGFNIKGSDGSRYLGQQQTPEYIAPEALFSDPNRSSKHPDPANLGRAQDNFALAVIIFKLINNGIHPFNGIPKGSAVLAGLQEKIDAEYYPYGLSAHSQIAPAHGSLHYDFPQSLRELCDRAFTTRDRPEANEWWQELRSMKPTIGDCDVKGGAIDHLVLSGKCLHCEAEKRRPQPRPVVAPPPRQTTPARGGAGLRPVSPIVPPPITTSLSIRYTWMGILGPRFNGEYAVGLVVIFFMSLSAFGVGLILGVLSNWFDLFIHEWRVYLLCANGLFLFVIFSLSPFRWWPVEDLLLSTDPRLPGVLLKWEWTWGRWSRYVFSFFFLGVFAVTMADTVAPSGWRTPWAYWLIGLPAGVAWQSITVWVSGSFFQIRELSAGGPAGGPAAAYCRQHLGLAAAGQIAQGPRLSVGLRLLFYGYWVFLAALFCGMLALLAS